MQPFFRLIHVSDTHFGGSYYPAPRAVVHWMRERWPFTHATGVEVHDIAAVRALATSLLTHTATFPNETTRLVMSGDLTTWGTRRAFDIAYAYLRESSQSDDSRHPYTLGDALCPVIPGNHDMWNGFPIGLITQRAAAVRRRFFRCPAYCPVPDNPDENQFPWQTCLYPGSDTTPALYLYGLDSTVITAQNRSSLDQTLDSVRAVGYVDTAQLNTLEKRIESETGRPRVRLAMIHHPLAYRESFPASIEQGYRRLNNLDETLLRLQRMGFAAVLCGHQHQGFVRQVSAPDVDLPPLVVLSVGTATQHVPLAEQAEGQTNEYRLYEFKNAPRTPHLLRLTSRVFRFGEWNGVTGFGERDAANPLTLTLDLNRYRDCGQTLVN